MGHLPPESEHDLVFPVPEGQDKLQAIYSPVKSTTSLKHNYKTGWFYLQRQGSKSSLASSGHHCTIISIIFPDTPHWGGGGCAGRAGSAGVQNNGTGIKKKVR